MSASSARQTDVPTLALTIVFCALGISASLLALTGIGCIAAISAIAFCRFFGRPYFAYAIIAAAAVALVHALAEGGAQIWSISFDAYWQTWVHGTFPVVTARIWLDPTEINRDRLLLASAGWIVGGISELILESIRNSRFTQLKMGGGPRRRAPIALVLAWIGGVSVRIERLSFFRSSLIATTSPLDDTLEVFGSDSCVVCILP